MSSVSSSPTLAVVSVFLYARVMPIAMDREHWPLIRLAWPNGAVSEADMDAFMTHSQADLERKSVHCILHISSSVIGLSAPQRKQMADHIEQNKPKITQWTAGVAIVTPSAIIRGMITAVSWLTGTPCPQKTFASEVEARTWLAEAYKAKTGQAVSFDFPVTARAQESRRAM